MRKFSVAAASAVAILALAGLSSNAKADLTLTGEVGLPLNPTAQIPQLKGVRLQGNYFDGGDGELYSIVAAGRAGAAPVEISGGYIRAKGGGDSENGFALGAKYLFTREGDAGVRLAAGAGYLDIGDLENIRAYGVATKYFGTVSDEKVPVTGHLGVRYDRFKIFSDSDSKVSVFAGVEVPVVPSGEVQFVGELGSKVVDGGSTRYSASVRYRAKQQPFGASIGFQREGVFVDKGRIFAQVGYTFGG